MKIQVSKVMKVKSSYSSQRETETSSFGACSVAMDDGGRCLLDVIGDPKLLQSFLESGSDENSKDPQDGTSSESAVESPQVPRTSHAGPTTNHISSNESLIDTSDHMGFGNTYTLDGGGLAQQGMSLVVPQTYQHASSSGATIHHMPTNHPPHSPARSLTPSVKSPGHSMPPPSPLTSHTPSPAPAWSPAPPVLSPAASSSRASAFQQQQQIIQTSCSVTQFVTALTAASQPVQQQPQKVFLQQQQAAARMPPSSGQPQMVQLIHHSLPTPTRTTSMRPIQPKLPPQILPKPTASQFVAPAPAPKQAASTQAASSSSNHQRVGIQPQQQPQAPTAPTHGQLVMGQTGMFQSPGGTILLNQIIPSMNQNHPILIQSSLQGLLLRNHQGGAASPGQAASAPNNTTLIAALQGHGQHAHPTLFTQAKSATLGQQTIVIPNNLGGAATASMAPAQNINLGPAGSGLISTSQPGQASLFARTSNIILSPRNQGGLQLQQLQTPSSIFTFNGQAFAVPHLQAAPTIMGQLSLQSQPPSALQPQPHPLFGTVPLEPVIQMQPQIQLQQQESPPKPPPKAPGVNLEELLKEHGIVPEESPPSPDCSNSPLVTCSTTTTEEQPQTMVPSQQLLTALQSQQVLLEQPQGTQFKVHVAPDGSMIFHQQPGTTTSGRPVQHFLSSNQLLGRTANNCVLLPTATSATAVSVPAVTMDSAAASRNHSTLIARLNAAPAISVPDVVCIANNTSTSAASTTASLSSSGYVVQRAGGGLMLATEDPSSPSPSSMQQNATLHHQGNNGAAPPNKVVTNSAAAFQALFVQTPAEQASRTVSSSSSSSAPQPTAKAQQSMPVLLNQPPPKGDTADGVVNNSGVQNHNHTFHANVPNSTNSVLLQKVQKKVDEMMSIKPRSAEQQKLLQQLLNAQQKVIQAIQKFGRGGRGNQNQYQAKMEIDVERLLQKCRTSPCVVSEPQQQTIIQTKVPVLTAQQSGQMEKQQSAKPANSHGVHLVNLLKQNQQLNVPAKLVASPTTTVTTTICDSTTTVPSSVTTVQKTNQVINSTPRLQNAHQQCSKAPEIPVPPQVIVRVQKPVQPQQPQQPPQQPSTVPSAPTLVQIKAPPPPPPVKKVVNTVPKTVLFNERLARDQNAAVMPDVNTPFQSVTDACNRLLSYHVYSSKDPSEIEIHKADIAFDEVSNKLIDQYHSMMNRYRMNILKESMITSPSSELVMLNQMFVEGEQEALKNDKNSVADGKPFPLPPPPKHWLEAAAAPVETTRPPPTPSPPVVVKVEAPDFFPDEQDSYSRDFSDPATNYDHLEAPVIDSCEDPPLPPSDDNIERSPPTLKRIVLKPPSATEPSRPPPRKKPRTDPYQLDFDMSPMEMGGPVAAVADFDPRATDDFDLLGTDWQTGGLDLSGLEGLDMPNGTAEDLQVQSAVKSITGVAENHHHHYYDGSGYHHHQSGFDETDPRTSVAREPDLEAAVRSILMREA